MAKWAEVWGSAKDSFKEATGQKKPDVGKTFFGLVDKHKTSIKANLKKVDECYEKYHISILRFAEGKMEEKKVQEALNEFGRSVVDFNAAKKDYDESLKKAVEAEIKDKNAKTLYSRAVQSMRKTLDAISADIDTSQKKLFAQYHMEAEKKKRTLTTQEMVSISSDPIILAGINSATKRANAFVSECKVLITKNAANPKPAIDHFNKNLQTVCRDITQGLVNAEKRLGIKLTGNVATARDYLVQRNGGTVKLADNTTASSFATEIKTLSGHAKAVETWVKTT